MNVKFRIKTKNHQREKKLWFKQNTKPRMKYEWIRKTIYKIKPIQKMEKKLK